MSLQFVLNGNLTIKTIDSQSGVFIGESIQAVGWSSHSKTNTIISDLSGDSSLLYHNLFFVNDPDLIDTPIDDRDVHLVNEDGNRDSISNLFMRNLNINSMQENSSVFLGKGTVAGMDANEKDNYATGTVYGDANNFLDNFNLNYDSDLVDGNIFDQDIKIVNRSG